MPARISAGAGCRLVRQKLAVCNLYSLTKGQDALRGLFTVSQDLTGNLPSLPGIFPEQMAPVIRAGNDGIRAMEMMRWGFPPPPHAGKQSVTNVRNIASAYWRPWLKPEWRCLVPATSFCEYTDSLPKVPHWFALGDDRPVFAFAGIWRTWQGMRKGEDKEHRLFAFLTTEANDDVRPVHAKAMPVVLTEGDWNRWLAGDLAEASMMQRPLAVGQLAIVATGRRADG